MVKKTTVEMEVRKRKKMGRTEQETEREKGERRLSPSRRTKDEANNGEVFSEAEVGGRSIFSPVSMQPREREGEGGEMGRRA